MAVIGDHLVIESDTVRYPFIFSLNDYYVFGATKRWSGSEGHRYGFNGQEKSTEINTEGNSYTAEFWQYDARLGRRWNVDPVTVVGLSDYSSFSGNPILKSDPDGDCAECPKKGAPAGTQHTERGPAGMTPVGGMVFAGKNASLTYINVGDEVNSQWVIGRFATNSGKSYTWNNDKKWYVDNEGKEYSQMIFHNMMDWAQRTMGKPMAEASKNFFDGIPFKDTRVAYAGYQLQGGYGVGGFIASGLANSVSEWGSDLAAGGHRTDQALIGLWRFSSEMAKGSGISFNAAKGGGLKSFSGTEKAWSSGATPNSIYTYLSGDKRFAVSNYIYNSEGKVIFQVDFSKHGKFFSGHGHNMSIPGNLGSGHTNHIPWNQVPSNYFNIPRGIQHSTPIGQ